MTKYERIVVEPLGEAVGAEVSGVELSGALEGDELAELRAAFAEHGVLFFRDQPLTPEQQLAFAERWGKIVVNRFFTPLEGYPQVAEVRKEPHQAINIGGGWHTDHSYDRVPALGSILSAQELPDEGGDTLFAGMAAAYDALSAGLKETLCGLRALHSSRHIFGEEAGLPGELKERLGNAEKATQDTVHPVVITHPLSGRKVLYVNPGFTLRFDGWSHEESQPLLQYLYEHASQPEFTCRFRWQPGSVAFWDNRATWHYALNDYPGKRRLMHRITLDGEALSQ
ncbi:MAG: TauD/TfdA family dioxygenase [Myxococcota bacterium]|nr:TauD/TfdA family dioxygenase [Myxococcota bacterium]